MNPPLNSRGGLDKVSTKEKRALAAGNTPTTPVTPINPATPYSPTSPVNRISLGELKNPTPVVEAPAPKGYEDYTAFVQRFSPNLSMEENAINSASQNVGLGYQRLQGKGARGTQLDTEYGITGLYDRNVQLGTQIADLTSSFNTAVVNQEGVARPQEFITGRQDFLNKQKAVQVESLSAAQAAVQGNIALAEQRIESTLEREFGDVETGIEAAKFELEQNKEALERKDKKAYEERVAALDERTRVLTAQKDERKAALDVMMTAAENNAPADVLARMSKAKTAEEAMQLGAGFISKPDIMTSGGGFYQYNPTTGMVEQIGGASPALSPSDVAGQGGNIFDVLQASSQFDKTLEASERQSVTKALNVAGQLRNLSDLVNLDSETYGPIIGTLRGINPFDTNAQQFKALIQGTVPNLARGIYGEVGVLTDQDIENYAKTLPTLTSTEEVQDAMLGLTLKLVRDSVRNQLSIAAESGINVSGLTNTVERLDELVGNALTPITMKTDGVKNLISAGAPADEIETLLRSGYEYEDVENYYLNGGNESGGTSFNDAITASADAIAAVESGGNYNAQGPILPSGQYAGQRALGKYQIMAGNVAPWSKEALGYSITPEQFLQSPELQDQIFAHQFGKAVKQHGSLEDAASVWFSGRPLAKAGNAKDVLGTSVPEYVKRFQSNLKLNA